MPFFSKKTQPYKVVEQNDEGKSMLYSEPEYDKVLLVTERHARSTWKSTLLWCLSITGNVVLASAVGALLCNKYFLFGKNSTVVKNFTYLPTAYVDKTVQRINGSLFPTANPSWSRMEPSLETDENWSWFDPSRLVSLSKDEVLKLGKDPLVAVQAPAEWDMPEGSYVGAVDLFHKMHCLNELRKKAFLDYPYRKDGWRNTNPLEELDWIHLRHCTDMLAQDLQCNANFDIQTFEWKDTQRGIYPDFSIDRTCTNWDQFLDWNEKHSYQPGEGHEHGHGHEDNDDDHVLEPPKGAIIVPAQDAFYQKFGFGGSVLYPGGKGYKPNGN